MSVDSIAELRLAIKEKIELGQIDLIILYFDEFKASMRARPSRLSDKELEDVKAIWAYVYADPNIGNKKYDSFTKLLDDYKALKRILEGEVEG